MKIIKLSIITVITAIIGTSLISCNQSSNDNSDLNFEKQLQEKFINAKKGDVIEIPEGKFELTQTLRLDSVPFVTIRGKAQNKTILSFTKQTEGAEGLRITNSNDLTIENLSVQDTKGNGIVVIDSKKPVVHNVAVGWTEGPKAGNGSYGISSVSCKNVLVEKCAVTAASVAGIFASQSENIIIRDNMIFKNVAGIGIENCIYADVSNNKSYNNTSGIFIFDLPGLPRKNGHHMRIYENVIKDNNLPNFTDEGNITAIVPAGTGLLFMSTREVEIFENEIMGHQTTSAGIISFLLMKKPFNDSLYNPFSSSIYIHNNKFEQPMAMPDTIIQLGKLAAKIFQGNNPNILFDGFIDPAFVEIDGTVREAGNICLKSNGDIKFANINAPSNFKDVKTDPNVHDCEQGELPAVEL